MNPFTKIIGTDPDTLVKELESYLSESDLKENDEK